MQQTNVSKKNLGKQDSYIILLNYHFCMLFASGQRLHTEQRILYCYIYIIKSTWTMQLSFLLHISSVSIFHFLYCKQWRGGTCFLPVIFLLQPVIWSPLSAWWHDVSAMSWTCHNKYVSLQGLTTPKRGTPFGYTSKYGVFEKKFQLCVIIIPWKWIFWRIRIHHTKGQIL